MSLLYRTDSSPRPSSAAPCSLVDRCATKGRSETDPFLYRYQMKAMKEAINAGYEMSISVAVVQ